ncbi:MAG: 4-hydroxy-tetrahydrodipicolinate reductase [Streptococcaceae bacterium]|jgi:4-hydroxy-tetrahydrodipicolinate reductase|nr:4-hydroxy-tetrahydrodipicolinate reductase [Streptococcaceae bacterium]
MKIQLSNTDGKMSQRLLRLISESSDEFVKAGGDVLIDFGHPSALTETLAAKMPTVIGTTGLSSVQMDEIRAASAEQPILYSANFSLGVAVLNHLVARANQLLAGWDVELIETHHNRKLDVPSGTANLLLDSLKTNKTLTIGRHENGARDPREIGVHSVRGGNIAGIHEVEFLGADETVTLKHEAYSADIFAHGALTAAKWLVTRPAGLYDMNAVLFGTSNEN